MPFDQSFQTVQGRRRMLAAILLQVDGRGLRVQIDTGGEVGLMRRRAANEKGHENRGRNAAADLTRQVEEGRCGRHFLVGYAADHRKRERDKDLRESDPADHEANDKRAELRVWRSDAGENPV